MGGQRSDGNSHGRTGADGGLGGGSGGEEKAKQGIAENIDFSVGKPEKHFLRIQDDSGTARAERVVVYGLRGIYPDRDFWKQRRRDQTGRKCYESKSFTVYEDRVEDAVYGGAASVHSG